MKPIVLCYAAVACSALFACVILCSRNNVELSVRGRAPSFSARVAHIRSSPMRRVAGIPVRADFEYDMSTLPYNAAEVGLDQAIEDAARVRDTAACRVLERVRRQKQESEMAGKDVPWYRGGSKDRERYDGVMVMSPLEEQRMEIEKNRRLQDQAKAEKCWAAENDLLRSVQAQGIRVDDLDMYGLPIDVARILDDSAGALGNALAEDPGMSKLISVKLAIDPMPWWEFPEDTISVGIARQLKALTGYQKVAVIPPPGVDISYHPTDMLSVNDIDNADVLYVMNPDLSSMEKMEELMYWGSRTRTGDIVVIDGDFGYPSSPDGKAIRQFAKDNFAGGIQSLQFIMEPVRLTRNVGGEPYPLPEWLRRAGYKATGNLAITGNSGTGKSSLTNAMRGLRPRDEGAAAVGVKETTLEPTPYDITVDGKEMRLYDLPGAGTPKFPLASYIRNMGIKYFDLVIVASAGRFTENDLELMDELRRHGVPFFALRTKIDLEIRNAESDGGGDPNTIIDSIRADLENYTLLPPDKIYMVSSRRPEEFDFQRLKVDTLAELQRGLEVKLAKGLTRKLEIQGVWNSV